MLASVDRFFDVCVSTVPTSVLLFSCFFSFPCSFVLLSFFSFYFSLFPLFNSLVLLPSPASVLPGIGQASVPIRRLTT